MWCWQLDQYSLCVIQMTLILIPAYLFKICGVYLAGVMVLMGPPRLFLAVLWWGVGALNVSSIEPQTPHTKHEHLYLSSILSLQHALYRQL